MISDYVAEVNSRRVSSEYGVFAQADIVHAWDAGLTALQNPEIVDNPRVNIVAGIVGRMLAANMFDVLVVPPGPPGSETPPIRMGAGRTVLGTERCVTFLPPNYHHMVKEKPLFELANLVGLAEFARGAVGSGSAQSLKFQVRAQALSADFMHTVARGIPEAPGRDFPSTLLDAYPNGFAGLAPRFTYLHDTVMPPPKRLGPEQRQDVAVLEATAYIATLRRCPSQLTTCAERAGRILVWRWHSAPLVARCIYRRIRRMQR
jgi:hypothetical protein